ncbi:MAG: UDP-N-acetylmuramoyl-L-alanyl-D-glutamate--2,6-diaminopimelate ligase [Lachnospiraceae bacterium]|nr:UDP-N-acetylmuramoyl-L-alanyl-D-glutamate--2,6-diaminopimelate ligase [Lachnospiraceae bacterium]
MKKLDELCKDLEYDVLFGSMDREYSDLVTDNRKLTKNCVYICIKGANFDGHTCVRQAVDAGAALIVVERNAEELGLADGAGGSSIIKVDSTRKAMALISCAYYDHPAKELTVIGITGTKGKTTTTYLIRSILEQAGRKVGLIGTIETIIGDVHTPAKNTTPDSPELQKMLRQTADSGCDTVVMEVSSQGLMLHRTYGIDYDIGIFTNIEPDHIGPNEHADFDDYIRCKSMLFRQCATGIVNGDDGHVEKILENSSCKVIRYGFREGLDYSAQNVRFTGSGSDLGMEFDVKGRVNYPVKINMPGRFSVYNALCAVAVCDTLGIDEKTVREAVTKGHVKGRIEPVKVSDRYTMLIDYAHNAMALESLLETLKEYHPKRLVCLFGCGGNRDRNRRFEMGEVSGRLADLTVITSDNPRNEDPMDIIADIRCGIGKTSGRYVEIPDRKEAIRYCIENGQEGDIIVLAGKGHEDYQEIKGKKYPMDERVLIADILKEMNLTGGEN